MMFFACLLLNKRTIKTVLVIYIRDVLLCTDNIINHRKPNKQTTSKKKKKPIQYNVE